MSATRSIYRWIFKLAKGEPPEAAGDVVWFCARAYQGPYYVRSDAELHKARKKSSLFLARDVEDC